MTAMTAELRPIPKRVEPTKSAPDPLAALVPLLPYEEIFTPEPPAKVAVPALGISVGPINGFIGESYVGKTIMAHSLGLAVASGRPLWGVFNTTRGKWLHLDHELGRRHSKRYITRLMNGMGLEKEAMRGRFDLAIYPRLKLTNPDAESLYTKLFTGYDLVTIDAMRGLVPGVKENETVVRDYLDMLSRASEASGAIVVLIHHAGKPPGVGRRERKDMARGTSGIRDALQSMFVFTREKGEPIHVSHEKDRELGSPVDDFGLEIVDVANGSNPKWGLKVVHLEKEQLFDKITSAKGDPLERIKTSILKMVHKSTVPITTKTAIHEGASGGTKSARIAALSELIEAGKIVFVEGVYRCSA